MRPQAENRRAGPEAAANGLSRCRTLRCVPAEPEDKVVADAEVLRTLLAVFRALFAHALPRQRAVLAALPEPVRSRYQDLPGAPAPGFTPHDVVRRTLGFSVARAPSSLAAAGSGVFVAAGRAPRGAVVAMYPGNGAPPRG